MSAIRAAISSAGARSAPLTRDHTVASEHRRLGILTSRQAASANTNNLLSRCLGNEMFVNVDTSDHLLIAGDVLLLCSDGLHRSVTPADMAAAVDPKQGTQGRRGESRFPCERPGR